MASTKLTKPKGEAATPLETQIAQYLSDLETNANAELKAQLKNISVVAAKEVDVGDGRKAVVVFVPFRVLREVRRVQERIVNELEKKFSGRAVIVVAQRRILPKKTKTNRVASQQRPRSRTLAAVHDAILDDVVYPSEVVGRRTRVRIDGSRTQKVQLDVKEKQSLEHKLEAIAAVYKKLTGKDVVLSRTWVPTVPLRTLHTVVEVFSAEAVVVSADLAEAEDTMPTQTPTTTLKTLPLLLQATTTSSSLVSLLVVLFSSSLLWSSL